MERWIKLHNNIIHNKIFQNALLLKLFIYCLCKANYEETDWKDERHFETVHLMPGEFITSFRHIGQDIGATKDCAYRWIKQLEKDGCIVAKCNAHYTRITIVNWAQYQNTEKIIKQQSNTDATQTLQQSNTDATSNRNNRNIQNKKEKIEFESPFGEGSMG